MSRGSVSQNLQALTSDVQFASSYLLLWESLPEIPSNKKELVCKIDSMRCNLPGNYAHDFWTPAKEYLKNVSEIDLGYALLSPEELRRNYSHYGAAFLNRCAHIRDIAQVILQHGTNFKWDETCALQQFACDMWRTFVSSSGYCSTSHCLAPLVKWGDAKSGPWAKSQHTVNSIQLNGNAVPIVSFPLEYSQQGVLAWIVLGHEMAHTILESGMQLSKPLSDAVWDYLADPRIKMSDKWANYWTDRVSEAAADVMSVLYMGPAAAIGLIAYLRSVRADNKLSHEGSEEHPADILRGLVVAHVVKELNLTNSQNWFNYLQKEIQKDFNERKIGLSFEQASYQAKHVAHIIMNAPLVNGQSLQQIRCWNETDQEQEQALRRGDANLDESLSNTRSFRTPHIVAAANLRLLLKEDLSSYDANQKISHVFQEMIQNMKQEAQRQKEQEGCASCPSQKRTYTTCPPTPESTAHSSGDVWKGVAVAAGVIGIAALVGGIIAISNNSKKSGTNGARVQTAH